MWIDVYKRQVQGNKRILSAVLIQGQAELMEVIAQNDMSMCNTKISNLALPNDVLLTGIRRGQDFIIPEGDTMILPGDLSLIHIDVYKRQPGDRVIILSLLSAIEELERLLKKKDVLAI